MSEEKPVKTAEENEKKLDELFLELQEINNVFAAARKDLKPLGEEYSERLIRTQEICEEITELKKPLVEYLKKPVKNKLTLLPKRLVTPTRFLKSLVGQ